MRNDKSDCNLEPFHATLSKIDNKSEHHTTSLCVQFELHSLKSGGTGSDRSVFKGALHDLTVANTCQLHQLAQKGCVWIAYYSKVKYNIPEVHSMRKTRKEGNGYYACAMTKVPVTWNCFIQPCGNLRTTTNMTLPPCLCNLKTLQ